MLNVPNSASPFSFNHFMNKSSTSEKASLKILQNAVEHDEKKEYAPALLSYMDYIEFMFKRLKEEKNVAASREIVMKIDKYMSRAETVKRHISSHHVSQDESYDGLDRVAGLENVKQALREAVILPLLQPKAFSGKRKPWKGILLYGPPGTGKTFIVKKLSNEAKVNFISTSSSDVFSKYQGDSEKSVKTLFDDARSKKPCIILFDEVDSIGRSRDSNSSGQGSDTSLRVLTEFLRQLDGVGNTNNDGVIFIGATNCPWEIDSALRRRFEKRIYVPLPDKKARMKIIQESMDDGMKSLTERDIEEVAELTEGYSGADLSILSNEALMIPIRELLRAEYFCETESYAQSIANSFTGKSSASKLAPCSMMHLGAKKMKMTDPDFPRDRIVAPSISMDHIKEALQKTRPSVSEKDIERHITFSREFEDTSDEHEEQTQLHVPAVANVSNPRSFLKRIKKAYRYLVIMLLLIFLAHILTSKPKPTPSLFYRFSRNW